MTPLEIGSYIPGAENFVNQADTSPEPAPEPGTVGAGCPDTDDDCPY